MDDLSLVEEFYVASGYPLSDLTVVEDHQASVPEIIDSYIKIDDYRLSTTLSVFEKYPPNIRIAAWTIYHTPRPDLMNDICSVMASQIITEVRLSTATPVACLEIVQGKVPVMSINEKDSVYTLFQNVLSLIATEDVPQPRIIFRRDGNAMPVLEVIDKGTLLTNAMARNCVLATQRLINKGNVDSFKCDKLLNLDSLGFSFEKYLLIQDCFEAEPSREHGIDLVIPGNTELTMRIRASVPWVSAPLKESFDKERFEIWKSFVDQVEQIRSGFSKMLLCLMRPALMDVLMKEIVAWEREEESAVDRSLVDATCLFVSDNYMNKLVDNATIIEEINEHIDSVDKDMLDGLGLKPVTLVPPDTPDSLLYGDRLYTSFMKELPPDINQDDCERVLKTPIKGVDIDPDIFFA